MTPSAIPALREPEAQPLDRYNPETDFIVSPSIAGDGAHDPATLERISRISAELHELIALLRRVEVPDPRPAAVGEEWRTTADRGFGAGAAER